MAIQYIGTTISGLAGDTKPTLTANEKGVVFVETDTNKIYQWDGDSWNITTATDASTSTKGVASFDSGDFSVSSGAVSLADDITIAGNLTVSGDTITANTANLLIEDPLMVLAKATSGSPANDAGLVIERGSSTNAAMIWDESADEFAFITTSETGGTAGNINMGGYANLQATLTTAAQPNITSVGTLTTLTIDNIIINGANIGHTSDTNAIAIASDGVVTMDQIPVFSAGINVSGGTIAGTLATAAQGNITSLGTLTTLTVDNVIINGTAIGHTSDTDLLTVADGVLTIAGNLVPSADDTHDIGTSAAAWQDLYLEGDIEFTDAGVLKSNAGDIDITPSSELNITKNGSVFTRFTDSSDSVTITVGSDTTYGFIGSTTAHEFQLWSGNDVMAKIPADRASFEFQQATTLKTTTGALTIDGDDGITLNTTGTGGITMAEVTDFPDGSASAPSITNNGDTNTGLYFSAADAVSVTTAGTERIRIDSSGNLELKTSNTELRFYEGANYVGFEAPALSGDQIWVLPTADGSADQMLKTDGSGTLSWGTASAGTVQLVANGALGAGAPVAIGTDGKAIAISTGPFINHDQVDSSATGDVYISYDPNVNKVLAFYRDNGDSNKGKVAAGTVASDGSITWGTPCVFNPGDTHDIVSAYSPDSHKHFVGWRSVGDSNNFNGFFISVAADLAITMHDKSDGTADTSNVNTNENRVRTIDNGYFGNADFSLNSHQALYVGDHQTLIIHCDNDSKGSEGGTGPYGELCYSLVTMSHPSDSGGFSIDQGGAVLSTVNVRMAGACYDPDTDRVIVAWRENSAGGLRYTILYPSASDAWTVCGPGVDSDTFVPAPDGDANDNPSRCRLIYDETNNKVVLAYLDGDSPYDVVVVAGTVSTAATSGMTVSWGTPKPIGAYVNNAGASVTDTRSSNHIGIVHDTTNDKIVLTGDYKTGGFEQYVLDYGAGTTFTLESAMDTFSDAPTFPADGTDESIQAGLQAAVYDPDNEFVLTIIGNTEDNQNGKTVDVIASDPTGLAPNTSSFIGVNTNARTNGQTATITVSGGVNESVSSLTAGTVYYLAGDGTLSSTTTTKAKVGVALSATKLLVGVPEAAN